MSLTLVYKKKTSVVVIDIISKVRNAGMSLEDIWAGQVKECVCILERVQNCHQITDNIILLHQRTHYQKCYSKTGQSFTKI